MAPLRLRCHSGPSPAHLVLRGHKQQIWQARVQIPQAASPSCHLTWQLMTMAALSPRAMLVTHIWISEVFGHHGNALLISNGTTKSTPEIRTLQWQPHSSSHFWLLPITLCRTPGLQRRSITRPSPCAQTNPCSKGCSVTSPTRLIGFKSKCLLWFHWAIRGQIWHPFLLSWSHFSADILEVLGEFQVVTCNLAAHSQALLSADKAATSQGKADSCCSKEPLKPLFNHLILLLVPLSISLFWEKENASQLSLPGFPKFAGSVQTLSLHQLLQSAAALGNGTKIDFHTDPSEGTLQQMLNSTFLQNNAHIVYSFPLLSKKITNHRKCWTNCFNLSRSLRKLPFPIVFSPLSIKPSLNPECSSLLSSWIKVTEQLLRKLLLLPITESDPFPPFQPLFFVIYSIYTKHVTITEYPN